MQKETMENETESSRFDLVSALIAAKLHWMVLVCVTFFTFKPNLLFQTAKWLLWLLKHIQPHDHIHNESNPV